jgi:hypothetical protein
MSMSNQELRELLFDDFSQNLSAVDAEMKDTFRCPVCLKDFIRSDLYAENILTLGHIGPEAVGGRRKTLECVKCNSNVGWRYDSHVATMRKDIDWASRKEGTEKLVKFKVNGTIASAMWSYEKNSMAAIKATDRDDPNYKALTEELKSHVKPDGTLAFKGNASFRLLSKTENRVLSAIHAAYLMMFSCFGYGYVLSPEAEIIRKIIQDGEAPWPIENMEWNVLAPKDTSLPSAGILRVPENMKSFAVALPSFYQDGYIQVIFLPGFGGLDTFANLVNWRSTAKKNDRIDYNMNMIDKGPLPPGLVKKFWEKP